jgi:V8-like Glu-specific endopeptidase
MPFQAQSFPYDSVVPIVDEIGGQLWQGSGVLIAPDEVLTVAHVVYHSDSGAAIAAVVAPGYDAGNEPYGLAYATIVHYNPVQDSGGQISLDQSQYDYAVIHLSRPFPTAGTMGLQADFPGGSVTVSGYPGDSGGRLDNSQQNVTKDPYYTLLDGTSIGPGSSGGPVWIFNAGGNSEVVGLVSSGAGGAGAPGFFVQLTQAALAQIESWVLGDESGANATVAVFDTTAAIPLVGAQTPYVGPVQGLQSEYVLITSDSLNISVNTLNWFIHTGGGNDAIAANSGTNVLDGGTGSNFLTGGDGTDTFFVDDRGPTADIWSSANNFHSGDAATIWGATQRAYRLSWTDGQGAPGYTGLTLHATAAGKPTASLTLVGYSSADLSNGRLSVSFGTDTASGSAYMYIHGTG